MVNQLKQRIIILDEFLGDADGKRRVDLNSVNLLILDSIYSSQLEVLEVYKNSFIDGRIYEMPYALCNSREDHMETCQPVGFYKAAVKSNPTLNPLLS